MLSRVADNLYWFSRYVRRAENTARLVGVGSQLQLDLPRSVRFAWRPMVDTVGAGETFAALFPGSGDEASDADVVRFLLLDERNPSSLRSSVDSARELLRGIRDTLPGEVWEAINDLYLYIEANGERGVSRRACCGSAGTAAASPMPEGACHRYSGQAHPHSSAPNRRN